MKRLVLLAGACLFAAPGLAAADPAAIALDPAHSGSVAAITACAKSGHNAAAAIVDAQGFVRMTFVPDGAPYKAGNEAQAKARLAATAGESTTALGEKAHHDAALRRRIAATGVVDIRGGVPILANGKILGGIAVSGAPDGAQDEACASAGLAAIIAALK